jgi:membrane protein YqaA with SNARE-associated domain
MGRQVIPSRFQEQVIPVITSKGFHRTLWIIILVATMGNFCLNIVNFLFDLSLTDTQTPKTKHEDR